MSIKSKVLAGAAALTMVSGMGALATGTAHAATPSCDGTGTNCINFFSHAFGSHTSPKFVMDVLRQGQKAGQPVILFRASNNDPAEDFSAEDQGYVSDFTAAGLISKTTNLHYGGAGCANPVPTTAGSNVASPCAAGSFYPDLPAFQIEYSPYGVGSGLCVGTSSWNGSGKVVLESCGTSARTIWIADSVDGGAGDTAAAHGYVPLINGAQTNYSHPWVLTYPQNAYPTDMPRPQLMTQQLSYNANGGVLSNLQLWGATEGQIG
jgi:hypothetical protein